MLAEVSGLKHPLARERGFLLTISEVCSLAGCQSIEVVFYPWRAVSISWLLRLSEHKLPRDLPSREGIHDQYRSRCTLLSKLIADSNSAGLGKFLSDSLALWRVPVSEKITNR